MHFVLVKPIGTTESTRSAALRIHRVNRTKDRLSICREQHKKVRFANCRALRGCGTAAQRGLTFKYNNAEWGEYAHRDALPGRVDLCRQMCGIVRCALSSCSQQRCRICTPLTGYNAGSTAMCSGSTLRRLTVTDYAA